jgi:hypothetical protein
MSIGGVMVEMRLLCDHCGDDIKPYFGNAGLEIDLTFYSGWNSKGDKVKIQLCGKCSWKALRLLGFQYDTGKILSLARREMIDEVKVHGPHGGGIDDIALNGVGGAHGLEWHTQKPDVPLAGAMMIELIK